MQFLSGWSSHGRITARSYDYIDTMPPDRENAEIGVKISFFTLKSLRFPDFIHIFANCTVFGRCRRNHSFDSRINYLSQNNIYSQFMLKYYIRKLALLLIAGVGLALPMHAEAPLARRGVVRVELQPEAAAKVGRQARVARKGAKLSTGIQSLSATAQKLNAVSMEPVFVSTPATAERHAKWGLDRWYDIKFDESIAPEEAVALMERTPGVVKAQKIVPMQRMEGGKSFVKIGKQMASAMTASAMPFNDPRLPLQWHYHNDGSIADTRAGADINLFNAWKETTGRPEVIVAIIDGGVDYTHEDLAANMLVNEAEANGLPGVDDDGNGFIDDIYGYNFVTNSGEVYPHDHGPHVAGTVAAVTNNGVGVAGASGEDHSARL